MKKHVWLNVGVLVVIACIGYVVTLMLDHGNHTESGQTSVRQVPISVIQEIEGTDIKDFTFSKMNGRSYALSQFSGQKILLNFWASWCLPCLEEFPVLIELARENPELILVAVSSDMTEDAMKAFINKIGIEGLDNIYVTWDENGAVTQSLYDIRKLPETVIIDKTFMPRYKLIGADWSIEDVRDILGDL